MITIEISVEKMLSSGDKTTTVTTINTTNTTMSGVWHLVTEKFDGDNNTYWNHKSECWMTVKSPIPNRKALLRRSLFVRGTITKTVIYD
jgi:hypothetical protein